MKRFKAWWNRPRRAVFSIRSAEGASCMANRPGANEAMKALTAKVIARQREQKCKEQKKR